MLLSWRTSLGSPRPARPAGAEAIDADGRLFAAELPDELTAVWGLPAAPLEIQRVEGAAMIVDEDMVVVSPHFTDPARLRGGAATNKDDEEEDAGTTRTRKTAHSSPRSISASMPKKRSHVAATNGKVGGMPVWLDPAHPLEREQVVCGVCRGGEDDALSAACARARSARRLSHALRLHVPSRCLSPDRLFEIVRGRAVDRSDLAASASCARSCPRSTLATATTPRPTRSRRSTRRSSTRRKRDIALCVGSLAPSAATALPRATARRASRRCRRC